MKGLFKELGLIPKQGIYSLSDQLNNIFISFSSNIPLALVRNLKSSNLVGYEFKILEIVTDKSTLRLRSQFYKDHYSKLGYNLINNIRDSNLRVSLDVINDFRHVANGECLLAVKVLSKGYYERIVGVFELYSEAHEFMSKYYAAGVYKIVTSDNALTKEYLSR